MVDLVLHARQRHVLGAFVDLLNFVALGRDLKGVWCGVVWRGVLWCGVEWSGVVWSDVVWCGAVECDVMM